ncbi:MAG: indolepyruvate ferredoxin oxidoreductase family protein, partial [Sulfuritalea sp.]|nr:indolepyruvate ferredoxin oxidoreductase family protein [Sulfuritalea sp.]
FANMGDGTYFHSGLLAIRAAVAGKINITYKLLFNDAVAMTGGQPLDGTLTVPQLTRQLAAEDVKRIIVMSDEPEKYAKDAGFAPGVEIRHRAELDRTQIELRETPGVTALIYDQTCAAEKRRRRKRGRFPDPAVRIFINELVCEGCGDCSVKSNCLAVVPVETEFGRKRAIDQHACNKDYSCLDGFCPSIVTVLGGKVRRGSAVESTAVVELPEPDHPNLARPYGILVAGVGGTGVVTIGALLGMAAHLEGKGVTVLDMTGLAQKGGAVMSHVRIAEHQSQLHSVRIATGEAMLLLGCDIVVAVSDDVLSKTTAGATRAVVNTAQTITADFIRNPDRAFPEAPMEQAIVDAIGAEAASFIAASHMATRLMGNSMATNIFLLGYAFQRGLVPLSSDALLRAIELNGSAAEENRQAFAWGRRTALDRAAVEALAGGEQQAAATRKLSVSLDEAIERRRDWLRAYQDEAYANRYVDLVARVRQKVGAGDTALTEAVARNYFKLLAYKDEFEVARLFVDPAFRGTLEQNFEGDYQLNFHVTLPWSRGERPGEEPKKIRFGPWLLPAMQVLARLKFLRGTAFDPFGWMTDRRQERQLIADYEADIESLLSRLDLGNLATATEIAALPELIRGYGPVKQRAIVQFRARHAELLARIDQEHTQHQTAA